MFTMKFGVMSLPWLQQFGGQPKKFSGRPGFCVVIHTNKNGARKVRRFCIR
jgi:hypothetical protein